MCGIAGWVSWNRNLLHEQHVMEVMGTTLACRGPDAKGMWISPRAAFSHRRLTVVDPVGGAQPMIRQVGEHRYVLVYNGELYNTEDLRRDLQLRGHTFTSYSDTEVLLVSYVEWGTSCVERFNGIFAFGIWDEAQERLFLGRDRLGVKPLFYARQDRDFMFGSELKTLLAHPAVSRKVDADGLAEIFAVGPARTPGHGVFRDISELRPGCHAVVQEHTIHVEPYWQLQSYPHVDDLDTTAETVRELLVDTVRRQLVSDVPVCTFLSGGLDSSAVSAIAAEAFADAGKEPLHTYSIEFAEMEQHFKPNSFQTSLDAPWARRVANHLGSVHHPLVFDMPEMLEQLRSPLAARDLPGMADIDTSLFLFCREVKRSATVALSGESADEVFGGYPWFHREESLKAQTFPWSLRLQERTRILSHDVKAWIRPEQYVADRYAEALAEVPALPGESLHEARVREIGYLSITRFLPTLLDRKDRMSMASGLEVRVPFCDHRLVQYVFNIPWELKACDNHIKGILRRAMKDYLPEDALYRKKSPYPSTPNPKYLEAVRTLVLEILDDPASPLIPLVDADKIRHLAEASLEPMEHRPWFGQIMATAQLFHYLYEVDSWLRDYRVELV